MAAINSSNFAKALQVGVNAWYGKAYDEYKVEWTNLFEQFTSRKAFEEDVGVAGFGLAQVKPEGSAISYDTEQQGFITRYSHVRYGLGFVVTYEMFQDDQYDVVAERRARGLAFSMRQTKEIVGANIYNRAFNSSFTGGDGKEMISNGHLNISGGTYSNILSTPANISEAALEQSTIDIAKFTNDRGLRIAVMPSKLIIPVDSQYEVERILKGSERYGTANRDINAMNRMGKFQDGVVINHYLTSTTAWFIRTNVQDGLKYFSRADDAFGEDNDWDTDNAKFKATARYSFGWTDPRGIYGSQGV